MRWIVRLAVLALLAIVGLRLQERRAVVAAAGADLVIERQGVQRAEEYVGDLDARIDETVARLRDLDGRVSAFEARYRDGIPPSEHDEYERLLGQRNEVVGEHNDLIARRRSAVQEYEQRLGHHNARVERANALAAESTPWRSVRALLASLVGG